MALHASVVTRGSSGRILRGELRSAGGCGHSVFVRVRSVDVSGYPRVCVGVCLYDGGCVSASV